MGQLQEYTTCIYLKYVNFDAQMRGGVGMSVQCHRKRHIVEMFISVFIFIFIFMIHD